MELLSQVELLSRYRTRRTAMDLEPDAHIVSEADEFPSSEGDVVRVERDDPDFSELGELAVAAAQSVHGGYPNTGGTVRLSDVRLTMAMNAASKKIPRMMGGGHRVAR